MADLGWFRGGPGRRTVFVAVGLLVAYLLIRSVAGVYVELLWHQALGYESVYWRRSLWRWGLRLSTGLFVVGLVWINVRLVASTLGTIRIRRRFANIEIAERLPRAYLNALILMIAVLMGLWFSTAVTGDVADRVLLFLSAEPWGVVEPILGRDLGYYVFLLPLISGAISLLFVLVFLTFSLCLAGYAGTGGLRWSRGGLEMGERTRAHLTALVGALVLLAGVRFGIARHLLLVDGHSAVQGIFGLTDHEARLPAYQGLAVVSLIAAVGIVWGGLRNRAVPVFVGIATVIGGGILVGEVYPAIVQRFRVVPNELARETPYIQWNLEFTREGFGIGDLERQPFDYRPTGELEPETVMAQLDGMPVWTPDAFLTTLRSLEARFPYYEFPFLAIDRYETAEGTVPVAIAVRELVPAQLPESTWQTRHLRERFLAGQGAVVAHATERTAGGQPEMMLSGIPPEVSGFGGTGSVLALDRPQVYVAATAQEYAAITPTDSTFLAPDSARGEPGREFPPGIQLNSMLRRVALAWRFQDLDLLVSSDLNEETRFVFRRRAVERVMTLAPFLRVLDAPYPVVYEGRLVWILEGYTLSSTFPLASPVDATQGLGTTRYIRNSVKATVDALTGEVALYRVDEADPIVEAYSRAFPGLFRPLGEMPAGLRDHVRYPAFLLQAQARVLGRYHQESPAVFYGQQDVWALAEELSRNDTPVEYAPGYGLYRLPGDDEEGFHLTTVFVPQDRPNLTAVLVARSDGDRYGDLVLLDIPVEAQVPGPRQVEALLEQDPVISPEFTLWRQGGSQVWLGHLHVIPVGDQFLYMEPVFLAASGDAIPQVIKFVVSDGRRVAMQDELGAAVAALWGDGLASIVDALESEDPASTGVDAGAVSDSDLVLARDLLRRAEALLREGDYAGYGEALAELRALLDRLAGGG